MNNRPTSIPFYYPYYIAIPDMIDVLLFNF